MEIQSTKVQVRPSSSTYSTSTRNMYLCPYLSSFSLGERIGSSKSKENSSTYEESERNRRDTIGITIRKAESINGEYNDRKDSKGRNFIQNISNTKRTKTRIPRRMDKNTISSLGRVRGGARKMNQGEGRTTSGSGSFPPNYDPYNEQIDYDDYNYYKSDQDRNYPEYDYERDPRRENRSSKGSSSNNKRYSDFVGRGTSSKGFQQSASNFLGFGQENAPFSVGGGNIFPGGRQTGFVCLGAGCIFTILGISLFFEKMLIRLGNILFVISLPLIVGPNRLISNLFVRERFRALACFSIGFLLVLNGRPFWGLILEIFGFFNLFGNLFPFVLIMAKRMPIIGDILNGGANRNQGGGNTPSRRKKTNFYSANEEDDWMSNGQGDYKKQRGYDDYDYRQQRY